MRYFAPLMSEMGQNPKLPHRNIEGRFTSISRHPGVEMLCS
jgi:hypothetical protein